MINLTLLPEKEVRFMYLFNGVFIIWLRGRGFKFQRKIT